ncbi:hypothetical protein NJC38_17860 [Pseudomonas sp. 21LCFQ010]|uniref:hypothetical protein n=1 Tax=Pseudomonas sp. 21LCFQ010 TaxID=2957506 RepID=UPI002096C352|nr:hypothetical protein [Pseudomonas sp. 21LCFQ010]MCO8164020.1 hypothetical protein [Pseudomonas sp. 21LCFQ010]
MTWPPQGDQSAAKRCINKNKKETLVRFNVLGLIVGNQTLTARSQPGAMHDNRE